MAKPDYTNSIVNLMSSIGRAFGKKSRYQELKQLPGEELKNSKNVVLMVIDALGYNYLASKDSRLKENLRGKMTSVYPTTTPSAITTFMTGTAPQQHALPGWSLHLKELGLVAQTLPFNARLGGPELSELNVQLEDILDVKCFYEQLDAKTYVIQNKNIIDSSYTIGNSKTAERLGHSTFKGCLRQMAKAIRSGDERKYIYAYWAGLDTMGHQHGINSKETEEHFFGLEKQILSFARNLKDTSLIITADHGQIDYTEDKIINVENHPKLEECLTLPLCGDARTIYCYVHPSKARQFEDYVGSELGKFCKLYKNHELIEQNYYGLFEPNPKLFDRTGDYIIIMKDNYVLKDKLVNEKRFAHIGEHSGDSEDEMFVPLVVFNR